MEHSSLDLKRHKFGTWLLILAAIISLFSTAKLVSAQGDPEVVWLRWDGELTVDNNQVTVSEVHEVAITDGVLRFGTRGWPEAVDVLGVQVAIDGGAPQTLRPGNADVEGTYSVTQQGGEYLLRYNLPTALEQGQSFVVQMDYTRSLTVDGVVDWTVVPSDHPFPIESSSVVLNFPEGEAPDSSLVRVTSGDATVFQEGNRVIVESNGTIEAGQALALQIPFGAGVGAAGDSSGTGGSSGVPDPVQPVPPANEAPESGGGFNFSSVLMLICLMGILLLFGGGNLLRGLLGGLGGTPTGRTGYNPVNPTQPRGGFFPPQGPSTRNRGFRRSADQGRSVPTIRGKKDNEGGSANFG